MVVISEAPIVWNLLKGIICVYKPTGVKCGQVRNTIIGNLCKDLCELKCRPPIDHISIEGDPTKSLTVQKSPSYADHPLVVGPRYQPCDFRCTWATYLGKDTSGVFVLGLNAGLSLARRLHMTRPTRAYHIQGIFGQATDNYFQDGRIVEKATFHHIKRIHMARVLSSMQAAHQKQMFEQCGVDLQSQAAYELAVQGLVRPSSGNIPVIYSIKCIHLQPPHFTLEVQCINEYEMYLKTIIHEVGMQLRSVATCTSIQCIRHGHLKLDHALLRKYWHLQQILDNMAKCRDTIDLYEAENQTSATLVDPIARLSAG
uniref:Pseudouridine synthase II N-terminal domain-containing protein n=2 Tax=Timema TaxID=61471 RepID=A0A7R9IDB2_9NEOP|nr:unnamed protein product [Timema tahoe]